MKNIKHTKEPAKTEGMSERERKEREKALAATRKRLGKFNQPNQFLGSRNAIGCVSVEISQRCNLSCSLCYLSENSNDIIDLPLSEVLERLEGVRRNFGVGTNVQISGLIIIQSGFNLTKLFFGLFSGDQSFSFKNTYCQLNLI